VSRNLLCEFLDEYVFQNKHLIINPWSSLLLDHQSYDMNWNLFCSDLDHFTLERIRLYLCKVFRCPHFILIEMELDFLKTKGFKGFLLQWSRYTSYWLWLKEKEFVLKKVSYFYRLRFLFFHNFWLSIACRL